MMSWILLLPLLQNIHMRCKNTRRCLPLAVVRLRLRVRHGNSKTTISRAGCKFCSKTRRTTGLEGGSVKSEKERGKLGVERGERRGMSVVGWLVIDAGDKEAVARVKFRAGSGPVSFSSSAIASACHRCSRSECNKMLPIVCRRSVVFYCLCCCLCFFFCCCSLFSLLFRLFCFLFFLLCLLPTLLRVRARRADCGSRPSIS